MSILRRQITGFMGPVVVPLALSLLPWASARALAPAEINYQGKLTDATGNPQSGSRQMIFRLYNNANPPSPATALYATPAYTIPVVNGVFNAKIDVPAVHFQGAGGDSRWLEVVVEGVGMRPLHKLMSAPYALSVAAGSVSDTEIAAGAGIALSKLQAGGTFPNGVYAFPSQVNLPGSSAFMASGRLGIGNQNPQAPLDITSNVGMWGGWLEGIRFSRPEHSTIHHPGSGLFFGMHSDRNFYWGNTVEQIYPMVLSAAGNLTIQGSLISPSGLLNLNGSVIAPGYGRFDQGVNMNVPGVGVTSVIDGGGTWHRSYGQAGWYNQTYGGGWYMIDTQYVRAYNSKWVAASRFSDSEDVNHYVDPADISVLNKLRVTGDGEAPGTGKFLASANAQGNVGWITPPDGVPQNAVMFFAQATCPTGWSHFDLATGRVIVGSQNGDGIAGTSSAQRGAAMLPYGQRLLTEVPYHGHTAQTSTDGQHAHEYVLHTPFAAVQAGGSGIGSSVQGDYNRLTTSGAGNGGHSHNVTVNPVGTQGGVDVTMPYIQLLPCRKN